MTGRARAATVLGVCAVVVTVLTAVAVAADGPTALDRTVSDWVADHRSDALVSIMRVVTNAGDFLAVVAVGVACAAYGAASRNWRPLWWIIPTAALASGATNLLKLAVARPRPEGGIALGEFSGYSFPSGHATTAAALWGAVAVVLVVERRWSPVKALAAWALIAVAVSTSRVVLGAHWLTDVTAGIAVGSGFVAAAVFIAETRGLGSPMCVSGVGNHPGQTTSAANPSNPRSRHRQPLGQVRSTAPDTHVK